MAIVSSCERSQSESDLMDCLFAKGVGTGREELLPLGVLVMLVQLPLLPVALFVTLPLRSVVLLVKLPLRSVATLVTLPLLIDAISPRLTFI